MHKDKTTQDAKLATSNKMMATGRPKGGDLSKSKTIGGGSGDVRVKAYE